MPRVGSKQRSVRASAAIQRAIVTFCWLPPERRCTSRLGAGVDLQPLDGGADGARPRGGGRSGPRRARRALNGRAMFSRTERCMSRRLARSPGTSAMPARMASAGWAKCDRAAVDLDACRRPGGWRRRARRRARPGPGPRGRRRRATSPSRSSKETSSSLVPTWRLLRGEAGRAVARPAGGGAAGGGAGAARCGRRASARRCAPRRRGRCRRRRRSRRRAARWRGRRARRSRGSGGR